MPGCRASCWQLDCSRTVTTRSTPPDPSGVQLVQIASGFDRPLFLTNAGDGVRSAVRGRAAGQNLDHRRTGQISASTPFLDVSSLDQPGCVQRQLQRARAARLGVRARLRQPAASFTSTTPICNGNTVVARYHVSADNPDAADPNSATILLTQQQPYANHNGGNLAFGPDGYLYVGFGDGGSAGDPQGNGQNLRRGSATSCGIDVSADGYTVPADNPFVNTPDAQAGNLGVWAAQSLALQLRPRRPATSTSATWGRRRGKKSTSSRRATPAARTTAGTSTRQPIPTAARPLRRT